MNLKYGVDYLYLIGGLIILSLGISSVLGFLNDEMGLRFLLGIPLIVSAIVYLRYAFHLNYPNIYIRISILLIICSMIPYLRLFSAAAGYDIYSYLFSVVLTFGPFIFLLIAGFISLFIGYMKGRTNLEGVDVGPATER